jgi:hypothetical protein
LLLLSRGIDNRGDWIFAELIARDTRSRLVTINACQQQRSEAIPTTTCSINSRTEISDGVRRSHESAGNCRTTRSNSAAAASIGSTLEG